MATVLCVLYPDPQAGYPPTYIRDGIPESQWEPGSGPEPLPASALGFTPGELVGCVSGELGLRPYLEEHGHELIVTSDKDSPDSEFDRRLPEADVVISQPFWPAYLTKERIARAPRLKLALTAGVGSDHVDLEAAADAGITVAEVTGSNSVSVAEHIVMMILSAMRNFLPSHGVSQDGLWNVADCVERAYDVRGMSYGAIGAGRIGRAVLERLRPFGMDLHYHQRHRMPAEVEEELGLTYHDDLAAMVPDMDAISVQIPLYPQTRHLLDADMLATAKRGLHLVNCGRAELVDRDAVVAAVNDQRIASYSGDVWEPEPASPYHPWRSMPFNGMTPHIAGSTLSAQARYASGTLQILQAFLERKPIDDDYLIVDAGALAGTGSRSYQFGPRG